MGLVVGVTGGIGSGKSAFIGFLAELGARIINADDIARNVVEPGTRGYKEIVEKFGKEILLPDQHIDRVRLGKIVFGSDAARKRLNDIIHPEVIDQMKKEAEAFRLDKKGVPMLVMEIPLLFECGAQGIVDLTVVVTAEQDARLSRLKTTRNMSEEDALSRISSQLSDDEKMQLADVVIHNESTLDELKYKSAEFFNNYACS